MAARGFVTRIHPTTNAAVARTRIIGQTWRCRASKRAGSAANRPSVPMRRVLRTRINAMPPSDPARRARKDAGQARIAARHRASTSVPLQAAVTLIGATGWPR